MKVKPKTSEDSDVELDDRGYKSLPTVGVFARIVIAWCQRFLQREVFFLMTPTFTVALVWE